LYTAPTTSTGRGGGNPPNGSGGRLACLCGPNFALTGGPGSGASGGGAGGSDAAGAVCVCCSGSDRPTLMYANEPIAAIAMTINPA